MRGPLLLTVSLLLVVEILPAGGQAQVIDVGRRSVRAPFVRVQRPGRLRDRLRGRFRDEEIEVDEQQPLLQQRSPLQQSFPGAITPPPVPPARPQYGRTSPPPVPQNATARPDRQSLQTSLILAEAELDGQLNASASAAAYRKYLRVGRLSELLLVNPAPSMTDQTRQQLQQILDVYNRTLIDPRQRWVSRLSGFEKIQTGLSHLLAPDQAAVPQPEHVSVERKSAQPKPLRITPGEPQPTQVLPSVRDSR